MRPRLFRLAMAHSLAGRLFNSAEGVVAELAGTPEDLARFRASFADTLPNGATPLQFEWNTLPLWEGEELVIVEADAEAPLATAVPVDLATCARCRQESAHLGRRYADPFISCVDCGPRYTVLHSLPYERDRTSLNLFSLCPSCRTEYQSPTDRRFHAETIGCPNCGPQLRFRAPKEESSAHGSAAVDAAVHLLGTGRIVALLGLGGYQLLVDAHNASAVRELRQRKRRRAKPLAVMVRDIDGAQCLAHCDQEDLCLLADPRNPIVLVRARKDVALATEIACGLPTLGLFLPTTELHWQLLERFQGPLVVTSANLEGEPIVYETRTAGEQLASLADAVLDHNRPVMRPIDDSVVQQVQGRTVVLRAGRGWAPATFDDIPAGPPLLAVGGHQKVALGLAHGAQITLGPHLGDLESVASRARFVEQVAALSQLCHVEPRRIVHDLHPDFFTSRWSQDKACPAHAVQHHHAHVAAALVDLGWTEREVLGITWDGTGWGSDGTVWGGESLRATLGGYERIASLRLFPLLGGDLAARQPWRIAAALLADALGTEFAARWPFLAMEPERVSTLLSLTSHPQQIRTSSVGRLFDGVAALALRVEQVDYEGEAALLLESAADRADTRSYPIAWQSEGTLLRWDWRPMVHEVFNDLRQETPAGHIAMRFHRTLAAIILAIRSRYPNWPVVLAGGVFQNRLLLDLLVEQANRAQIELAWPQRTPLNDGGLALGQLAVARAQRQPSPL